MSKRIDFIEPVVVHILNRGLHIATASVGEIVVVGGTFWSPGELSASCQARIEAAKKLALAHLEAQKVADKVEHYEPGCFAIDRDGRKWTEKELLWVCDEAPCIFPLIGLMLLNPAFYKPRPVGKQVEVGGSVFKYRDGVWSRSSELCPKAALDAIWEQKQRIAELEAKNG